MGVGGDAEQAWALLEPAQRGGRLGGHARGVAGLDLAKEELLLVVARELGQFGQDLGHHRRPVNFRPGDAAGPGGLVVPGNHLAGRDGEFEAAEAGLDVKQVAAEALPAGVGVGRGRADFEERAVDVEDDGADVHVREFHKSG